VACAGDNAVRENGDREVLEIIGEAEIATVEKGTSLRGTLEHECAARADAEREMIRLTGAIDDFESVIVKAGIDFNTRDGFLHGEDVRDICYGF